MLSGPHQKFAERIVAGDNGTAAYQAAYPKASARSARTLAAQLLANVGIEAEIARLRSRVERVFTMDRAEWLDELRGIAQEARGAEDYSAATGALRQIGLAMPKWYASEEAAAPAVINIRIGE